MSYQHDAQSNAGFLAKGLFLCVARSVEVEDVFGVVVVGVRCVLDVHVGDAVKLKPVVIVIEL